jgi:hypothetical protein
MDKLVKIYALIDPTTKEIRYVGKTIQKIEYRLSSHIAEAKRNKSKSYKNSWIISLLNQGLQPEIKLIAETLDNWVELEQYWINYYPNLTNHSIGGEAGGLGVVQSKETVEKRIKSIKEGIACGKISYLERSKKISKAHKGKVLKESTKEKLRQINLGKTYSLETRLKKSKGGVLQYDLEGNLVAEYLTLTEASEKTKFLKGNISSACLGRLKTYKGFVWKYKNKDIVYS